MAETAKRVDRQEIARRVERGEKLLQRGKPGEALEEFLQTLSLDPANDTVRQMAADLCLSLQRLPDAVRLLGELFERQMAAGDAMRASLTYKKLARFANPTCEQKVRFAELLEKSNRKLAIETYEGALAEFEKRGARFHRAQYGAPGRTIGGDGRWEAGGSSFFETGSASRSLWRRRQPVV